MREHLTLERIQTCVKALPALPEAVREVMQVLEHDELSADRCVRLIEQDQALAARTLRVANSAFYGMPGRVARIGDAVTLLGLRAVSGVLLAASLGDRIDTSRCIGFRFPVYWRHVMGTAVAARLLAPRLGQDPDEAFVAGLLHDIGQLVLAAHFPEQASDVVSLSRAADAPSVDAERGVLGLTHNEVGACLVRHWRLPEPVAEAVQHHHEPARAPDARSRALAALVQIADALAHALDLSGAEHDAVPPIDPDGWVRLALSDDDALALFEQVEQQVDELCRALSM